MRVLVAAMLIAAFPFAARADNADAIAKSPPVPQDGAGVYQAMCQGCHMADGRGAMGAARIPALAGNPKLAYPAYPAYVVSNGYGAMPWFADKLSDAQIAAVVNYVRTHFGNHFAGGIKASEVAPMRLKPAATISSFD